MLYGILAPSDVTAATGEQVRAVAASFVAADWLCVLVDAGCVCGLALNSMHESNRFTVRTSD